MRSTRRACREQVQRCSAAIVQNFPLGTRISRPKGGFVLWVELPSDIDSAQLYHDALRMKINIAPGLLFTSRDHYRQCLRLNCGIPWSTEIATALETLGRLATTQTQSQQPAKAG